MISDMEKLTRDIESIKRKADLFDSVIDKKGTAE